MSKKPVRLPDKKNPAAVALGKLSAEKNAHRYTKAYMQDVAFARWTHGKKAKARFIEWLEAPKQERNPKSQAALARQLQVTPETLSRWKLNLR